MTLSARGPRDHVVHFYSSDDDLAGRVTAYVLDALRHGGTGMVIATPPHRAAIEARLDQAGVRLAAARADGSYLAIDAADLMSQFRINGFADPAGFWRVVSPLVKSAVSGQRKLHVFGEMVALLWAAGQPGAAVDLEALWNELATQYAFSLYCAYPSGLLDCPVPAHEVAEVLDAHSEVIAARGPAADSMSQLYRCAEPRREKSLDRSLSRI